MGMTIAERIFSAHCRDVRAGELVVTKVDFMMGQDGTSPLAVNAFRELGGEKVQDPSRVALVIDHSAPSPLEGVSNLHAMMRAFAAEQGVGIYDVGCGVCHCLLPEQGHVAPGDIVIGADSHTTTYGAINAFDGVGSTDLAAAMLTGKLWFGPAHHAPGTARQAAEGVYSRTSPFLAGEITADGAWRWVRRQVIDRERGSASPSNMAVEMGAKVDMEADEKTMAWLEGRVTRSSTGSSRTDADYAEVRECDLGGLTRWRATPCGQREAGGGGGGHPHTGGGHRHLH